LSIIVYVLRFFVISVGSAVAVLTLVFAPVSAAQGIDPFIAAFTVYCAGNVWYVFYNSIVWVVAYYATGGDMVEFKEMRKFSIAYMIISIIGLMASVPAWRMLGLLK
jgi:DASS family divalent anion:Na+ symporter